MVKYEKYTEEGITTRTWVIMGKTITVETMARYFAIQITW